jgi:hypothetical protein
MFSPWLVFFLLVSFQPVLGETLLKITINIKFFKYMDDNILKLSIENMCICQFFR